jgi:predicted Zn-dependent protease
MDAAQLASLLPADAVLVGLSTLCAVGALLAWRSAPLRPLPGPGDRPPFLPILEGEAIAPEGAPDAPRDAGAELPSAAAAPESPSARLGSVEVLLSREEHEEARALVAALQGELPDDPRLARAAGRLALRAGRHAVAAALLGRALASAPEDVETRLDLCEALAERGSFDGVLRQARRGLEQAPGETRLVRWLSEAAAALGAPDEALELAARALEADRDRASFLHLTRLLALTRRFEREDSDRLRRALAEHPREPAVLHAAGVFEAMHGRRPAAREILRSALGLEPAGRHRRAILRELGLLDADREPGAAARALT